MNFDTATVVTDAACNAGVPVNMRGGPGIGKTAIVAAIAAARGRHLETVLASVREPADFAGLPIVNVDATTAFAPPRWARTVADFVSGSIVFFDELSTAPPAVQAATLRVLTERWVGDLLLPADTWFVAAMNPVGVAAGGWDLTAPLANRLLHVDVEPNAGDWSTGMLVGWDDTIAAVSDEPTGSTTADAVGRVTGFISSRPDLFNACPSNPTQASGAWPSPRTWDYVTRVLPRIAPTNTDALRAAVAGLVGQEAAAEFFLWSDTIDLPDPADILADPNIVDWSDRGDRIIALLNATVSYSATISTADMWESAQAVVAAAVDAGLEDVAANVVKPLMISGKAVDAKIDPKLMAKFAALLERAGKIN